ncbi:hypothetical protein JCM13664_15520 [Methylothermus subterraneus]|nr:hypothetical conserved protein [uncultured Gammaproteobacteria bacterium]
MSGDSLWRIHPKARLLWEEWPEEAVVFNALSGQTHYLNATAMAILKMLELGPQSAKDLADGLYAGQADRFLPKIEQVLAEFERLGLIEPVE